MRALRRLRRRGAEPVAARPPYGEPGLVLLVTADDAARADSEVLAALPAHVVLDEPLLVVHVVRGVAPEVLVEGLDDGYDVVQRMDGDGLGVWRWERVTARGLAQERTRMAGLAQRLGGDAPGYELWSRAEAAGGS